MIPIDPGSVQAALDHATQHCPWAALRYSHEVTQCRTVRNDLPDKNEHKTDVGAMCEVLVDGHFGYAATADLSADGLRHAFDRALTSTRAASQHKAYAFSPAQRPAVQGHYQSARLRPLVDTRLSQITDCLQAANLALRGSDLVVNRSAQAMTVQTDLAYWSSSGAAIQQRFDMVHLEISATAVRASQSQTRTWSHTGQYGGEVFEPPLWQSQAERVRQEVLELLDAENCPTGVMDLVLMPDQMMLQIHESIGHPLELDRILGDERNYAGWSFVQPQDFGQLQYGSKLMNVRFDPAMEHEFASYAFDDAGNPAQSEWLIQEGRLLRGLGSLESQQRSGLPGVANFRSSSWNRAPIDRMANINLEPGSATLDELIAQVEYGVLMSTNRSWSIDDYRNKFQFGCERGQLIRNGKLQQVLRNPNYRGITVDFWNRLAGVGKDQQIYGTPWCGKGEPNQIIRVGHAAPPCWFKGVQVFGGAA